MSIIKGNSKFITSTDRTSQLEEILVCVSDVTVVISVSSSSESCESQKAMSTLKIEWRVVICVLLYCLVSSTYNLIWLLNLYDKYNNYRNIRYPSSNLSNNIFQLTLFGSWITLMVNRTQINTEWLQSLWISTFASQTVPFTYLS